ncbi:unnamed protein product [Amoebophrya sp. A25]|nr:unnamed protein product [Amoebophrya sp. A25]|eukprot:GSA25T00003184001.1
MCESAASVKKRQKHGMPFGTSSVVSPICRVMHFLSIELKENPFKPAKASDRHKTLLGANTRIGRIPIAVIDKNVEDRLLWQKKFGLLLGHRASLKGGLLPKPTLSLPVAVENENSPGCVSQDGRAKKEDVKVCIPGDEVFVRRNPLSSSQFAEGNEVAHRKGKIAEERKRAIEAYEREEEERRKIVAQKMAPPKGRKVSAAEMDEEV